MGACPFPSPSFFPVALSSCFLHMQPRTFDPPPPPFRTTFWVLIPQFSIPPNLQSRTAVGHLPRSPSTVSPWHPRPCWAGFSGFSEEKMPIFRSSSSCTPLIQIQYSRALFNLKCFALQTREVRERGSPRSFGVGPEDSWLFFLILRYLDSLVLVHVGPFL